MTDQTIDRIALYRVEIEGKLFGAYTNPDEADELVAKLRSQGMDAKVVVKERSVEKVRIQQ